MTSDEKQKQDGDGACVGCRRNFYSFILMCCGNTEMVGSWNTGNRIIPYFIEGDEQQKQDGDGCYLTPLHM